MSNATATPLGVLGHAHRRAIKSRSMERATWRAISSRLRSASRNAGQGYRSADRALSLLIDLERLTGCYVGWRHSVPGDRGDILAARAWGLHAFAAATQAETDNLGPLNCCGIPGALRVALAMQWHPTRRSRFAPDAKPYHPFVQTSALARRA